MRCFLTCLMIGTMWLCASQAQAQTLEVQSAIEKSLKQRPGLEIELQDVIRLKREQQEAALRKLGFEIESIRLKREQQEAILGRSGQRPEKEAGPGRFSHRN